MVHTSGERSEGKKIELIHFLGPSAWGVRNQVCELTFGNVRASESELSYLELNARGLNAKWKVHAALDNSLPWGIAGGDQ